MSLGTVLVTGGAGYVGSMLVPALLTRGYTVKVLDLYLYGEELFAALRGPRLTEIRADIRDATAVQAAVQGVEAVIHLACISNDPSYDLDPDLGKSINYTAFGPLVQAAIDAGVRRFVYASSSSVYGIKDQPDVSEEAELTPLTDYSTFKARCEDTLSDARRPGFETVVVRPSTVCGYAPRLRLDLVVNILTAHAFHKRAIKVFGGAQLRPNIHIKDMVALYLCLLEQPAVVVDGEVFNAGYHNHSVLELAKMVQAELGKDIPIEVVPSDDTRSYHVSSAKMRRALGFDPKFTIRDAVRDLEQAFLGGSVREAMDNPLYYNIRRMQQVSLK